MEAKSLPYCGQAASLDPGGCSTLSDALIEDAALLAGMFSLYVATGTGSRRS